MKYLPKNKILKLLAVPAFLFSMSSCDQESVQTLPDRSFEMVWSDEFNGTAGSLPDNKKWTFDLGTGDNGWGNQELQSYTNSTNNVSLDGNGNLVITARKNGNAFTSARVKTQGLFSHAYGKIEARIKTPYGPGIWPAFWMLGDNINTVSWPQCGEIDIMELKGHIPNVVYGTLHGPGYSGGNAKTKAYGLQNARFDQDFHVFGVEWQENQIDFFVDGYLYHRVKSSDVSGEWVYNHPFFLILNVAVGGNFVGFPTDSTSFPQSMYIDYVRVYKAK
ncbi:family 16 glycosylhydrolase [Chryseobacterium sp. EO14]|uniref:glycoside hydrolase family 16 protein n=1 Tax=Chryseobacterium sp. EO14 TaxID=2950551 RepID=UPI00210DBD8B|nr:glycoside hydrolase family 16 protein [Chryseobacterium sp. EO14]MCQ4138753.1 glycoside hydrolase family 16 protein [Chryseobacterium sp. EO14]